MANPKKNPQKKTTELINVRVSPEFKAKVKAAFDGDVSGPDGEPYESVSDWVRALLEADIARWEKIRKR